jgi:glutathione S-transferase
VLKLLGRKTSGNVQKVLWLLEELGVPYEREDYGRQFNNIDEKYLRLNPNGKVPTLVDGDVVIWESNSILRYLAGKNNDRFHPGDWAARSRAERWMDWQLATLDPAFLAIFRDMRNPPEQRSAQFGENVKALGQTLAIMDRALEGSPWVAGKELTVGDICLGPVVQRSLAFGVELPPLAHVRRWAAAVAERPAFKKATS